MSKKRRESSPAPRALEGKRNAVAALVLALALWPAAHYFVVDAYGLNPWNWFGWAMYTGPRTSSRRSRTRRAASR